jgi:hypothetical protein
MRPQAENLGNTQAMLNLIREQHASEIQHDDVMTSLGQKLDAAVRRREWQQVSHLQNVIDLEMKNAFRQLDEYQKKLDRGMQMIPPGEFTADQREEIQTLSVAMQELAVRAKEVWEQRARKAEAEDE